MKKNFAFKSWGNLDQKARLMLQLKKSAKLRAHVVRHRCGLRSKIRLQPQGFRLAQREGKGEELRTSTQEKEKRAFSKSSRTGEQ